MKKIVLVFIAVFLTVSGFAQKTADIGIWGGTSSYWGDVKGVPPIQAFNPNFGAYFRYNFNKRVGLRFQFLTGKFAADGTVEDIPWTFEKGVQDVSLMAEINYLNFVLGNKKTPFTPYILAGVGVMYFPYELDDTDLVQLALINPVNPLLANSTDVNESSVTASIPLGFGIKFSIGERLGIGAEYMVRKIFNDKLDDLDDPLTFSSSNVGGEETINYTNFLHNNDWPGYMGVHITYKIYLSPKACPAYDRKYW